jgi:hypothetical protein
MSRNISFNFIFITCIYVEGLIRNPNVPYLVDYLLPSMRSVLSPSFLRKWINNPPSHALAAHMRSLCSYLHTADIPLPDCGNLPINKVHSLLFSKQGNVLLFRDIKRNVVGVLHMLLATRDVWEEDKNTVKDHHDEDLGPNYGPILPHLLPIVTSETGEPALSQELAHACERILMKIDFVIATPDDSSIDLPHDDSGLGIPLDFFARNEDTFRGKLSKNNPIVKDMYYEIDAAVAALIGAIRSDYPRDAPIKHDMMNNMIYLAELERKHSKRKVKKVLVELATVDDIDAGADSDPEDEFVAPVTPEISKSSNFIKPIDRKGKAIPKRYTTQKVASAVESYLEVILKANTVTQQGEEETT